MAIFNCLSVLIGRKKKDKGDTNSSNSVKHKGLGTLQIKLEHPIKPLDSDELKLTPFNVSLPSDFQKNSPCNDKESPIGGEAAEAAYEGEDEHEEFTPMKRDFSDFDLQSHVANLCEEESKVKTNKTYSYSNEINEHESRAEKDDEKGVDVIQSGHVSDPGIGRAAFWASPKLKRSCSNLESREVLRKIASQLPPSKSRSFEELRELSAGVAENFNRGSPGSVTSHFSADKVMLKKRSSSQILPSRSRRLWWKLFLWSHRNLHKPWSTKPPPVLNHANLNQQGGYSSDTLEPSLAMKFSKLESPRSFAGESLNQSCNSNNNDNQSWDGFQTGVSTLWPQNQWVAFSVESSPFARVDDWVKELETQMPLPVNDGENIDEDVVFPPSPETGRSPARSTALLTRRPDINLREEILHANSVIQSLNTSSSVAYISGIGLKAIPTISCFTSLRSVNLSNNFIVHITPGSLPKGLHTLNLSKNKISTIEGLRELTRLRVLDLSYNRISRIGHGLSNCTLIKELYLAGNKIGDVEGLHRLLKLTVLDLSFNKITTTKALGQLVGNYNSLVALNLLGNPIQSNIGEDQLRKAICGLLPKLVYLNKQPIKPQRAREVLTDSVARAALGNGGWSSRRKAARKVSQSGSVHSTGHRNGVGAIQKSKNRSKNRTHQSNLKTRSSAQSAAYH